MVRSKRGKRRKRTVDKLGLGKGLAGEQFSCDASEQGDERRVRRGCCAR